MFRQLIKKSLSCGAIPRSSQSVILSRGFSNSRNLLTNSKSSVDLHAITKQPLDAKETLIRYGFGTIVSPFYLLGMGWYQVEKSHVGIFSCWGKYSETLSEGLHFRVPIGIGTKIVFIGQQSHKMPESKIVDGNGNPIIVSGINRFCHRL